MSGACELCDRDPAEGSSSISDRAGGEHRLCHPVTDTGPRGLSCLEIMGYTLVEKRPNRRRPPRPIPPDVQARARELVATFGPSPITHVRVPGLQCPYCTAVMDCAMASPNNDTEVPTDGAVSICSDCAQPSVFMAGALGVALRKPTPEEKASILASVGDLISELVDLNIKRKQSRGV